MRWLTSKPRQERGVSAVLFAIMAVCLVAATGLGVDTGNLALQSSRVQHSADAAAFAIAYDCVAQDAAKCSPGGGASTASDFATKNSSGGSGSVVGGLSTASTQVTVSVVKPVSTYFMGVVGIGSRNADNTATAQWTKHVISGNVLPYAVSLCAYASARAAGNGAQVFLRSDVNEDIKDVKKKDLESSLDPGLDSCTKPSDVGNGIPSAMSMLEGGLWISANGSNDVCNGTIDLALYQKPDDVQGKNEGCTKKYNDDVAPKGTILLLAVYAPSTNYSYGGVRSTGAVGTGGGEISDTPAKFGLQIVGFAPFKVAGWCLGQPLACGGDSTSGREGLLGSFIGSTREFDEAEYGTGGGNFGAVKVELIR